METMRLDKRMSDRENIPELNGTIKLLVEMLAGKIDTPEKQENAIKELVILQLNSWMLQKQVYENLSALLEERKSTLNRIIDKFMTPFFYTIGVMILWLVFSNFKP